jgi:hypothetical protein
MTIKHEDLKRYFRKSGDNKVCLDDNLIVNEHGFFSWFLNEDGDLVILNVYGDGPYWQEVGEEIARKHKCKKAIFATKRNPAGFLKRFRDFKLTGYILERDLTNAD